MSSHSPPCSFTSGATCSPAPKAGSPLSDAPRPSGVKERRVTFYPTDSREVGVWRSDIDWPPDAPHKTTAAGGHPGYLLERILTSRQLLAGSNTATPRPANTITDVETVTDVITIISPVVGAENPTASGSSAIDTVTDIFTSVTVETVTPTAPSSNYSGPEYTSNAYDPSSGATMATTGAVLASGSSRTSTNVELAGHPLLNVGAIAGIAVAIGVVVIGLALALQFWYINWRRSHVMALRRSYAYLSSYLSSAKADVVESEST